MKASLQSVRPVVAALLITLAGGFALNATAQMHGPHGDHGAAPMGPMMFMGSPDRIDRHVDRLLEGLAASDAQRTQIKQIARSAAADLRAQFESGRSLREQWMQLFTQPTVDPAAAESLRQQMLTRHDQTSKRMMQAMLDTSRVLTPEQRSKLAERTKARREMMQRHMRERAELEKR